MLGRVRLQDNLASKDEEAETVDPDTEYILEVDSEEDGLEVLKEGEELKSGEAWRLNSAGRSIHVKSSGYRVASIRPLVDLLQMYRLVFRIRIVSLIY